MKTGNAIQIDGLTKTFGSTVAVDNVSFAVRDGEVFGFMGHNGAGKTTTIRMLLGLLRPSGGRASVLGHDIVDESLAIRRLAGYLPGDYALPKEMTARRFPRYVGAMFGLSGPGLERRIDKLLAQFDLSNVADKRLGEFSSGRAVREDVLDILPRPASLRSRRRSLTRSGEQRRRRRVAHPFGGPERAGSRRARSIISAICSAFRRDRCRPAGMTKWSTLQEKATRPMTGRWLGLNASRRSAQSGMSIFILSAKS